MCQSMNITENTRELRHALGQFPTGVAIVTTVDADQHAVGMTINSFISISLTPALVAWSIDRKSRSYMTFAQCTTFAITVLSSDQADLALRFASRGADKFRGFPVPVDQPAIISGGCAWFQCESFSRSLLGDHLMLIGKVTQFQKTDRNPLVFSQGQFCETSANNSLGAISA